MAGSLNQSPDITMQDLSDPVPLRHNEGVMPPYDSNVPFPVRPWPASLDSASMDIDGDDHWISKSTTHIGFFHPPGSTVPIFARLIIGGNISAESIRHYNMWSTLAHPRIMPLLARGFLDLQFLAPDLGGAELGTYLKNRPETDKRRLVTQIAEALEYLHCQKGIVHGNLKPGAVYITALGDVVLDKLTCCTTTSKDSTESDTGTRTRRLHTLRYTAPEIVLDEARDSSGRHRSKTCAGDMYAFGMLVYEILSGRKPWADAEPISILRCIVSGLLLPRPTDCMIDDSMWDLCAACWNPNPAKRPDIASVLVGLRSAVPPSRWGSDRAGDSQPYTERPSFGIPAAPAPTDNTSLSEAIVKVSMSGQITPIFLPKQLPIAGGSGIVRKGYIYNMGGISVYAVKICRGAKIMPQEYAIWRSLSHAHILPLLGAAETYDRATGLRELAFVSQYLPHGNLVKYLEFNPYTPRLPLMVDVATGLEYLHNIKAIVHGDIKAENILISPKARAIIADFGLSTTVTPRRQETRFETRHVYTWGYCAPEVLDDKAEDPAAPRVIRSKTKMSDIYAYGVLLYQTYSGPLGASLRDRLQLTIDMYDGRFPPRPVGRTPVLCDDLWSVCKRCWTNIAIRRPPIATVLGELKDLESSPERQTIESVEF